MEPATYRMVVPVLTVEGAKRLPLWVCEAMPLGESCLRSRLKRSPYVGFAPLSWQRRGAQRLGRTSSVTASPCHLPHRGKA